VRKSCNEGEQAARAPARFWRGVDGGAGLKVRDARAHVGGEERWRERRGEEGCDGCHSRITAHPS